MKLAICIPARDTVHTTFVQCLVNLTKKLTKDNIDFEVIFNLGSVVSQQRNELVDSALSINATHIIWLDSDMHFPDNVFYELNKHNTDIVAATYSTRIKPQKSVAFIDKDDLSKRLPISNTGLEQVFAVGMGCVLTKAEVFKEIPKPWFFHVWNEDTQDISGEDIYFCKQANDTGFEIFVDCSISKHVAHYGMKAYLLDEIHEHS